MITNLRRRAASSVGSGGGSLPYDTEIEYLQSTGTQYIDTGIYTTSYPIKVEAKTYFSGSNAEQDVFGNYGSNSKQCIIVGKYDSSFHLWVGSRWQPASLTLSTWYDLSFEALTSGSAKMIINGNEYSTNISMNATASNSPIYLFCTGSAKGSYLIGRIGYVKITLNNVLVRDMIPVRVGQVGYMYDKVSGELFSNSGTGSFTLGPDVGGDEPVEPTCLALLHFDDSTNPFKDEMGNTWTISGTRSTTSSGKWSNCLNMSESSYSTKVTKSAYMSLPASDFTIDFWMKGAYYQSGYTGWRRAVTIEDGSSNVAPRVGNGDNSSHWYFCCASNDNIYTTRSTSTFSHHAIEYSFSTNQMRYYYNGTLQCTRSYTFVNPNNLILRIGEATEVYSPQIYLDELRVMSGCVYNGNSYTVPVSPYEYEAENYIWVRLDDLSSKISWQSLSGSYVSYDTKIPIYAFAGNSGTAGRSYSIYMYFATNPQFAIDNSEIYSNDYCNRMQLNAYQSTHVAYYNGEINGQWTGRDTYGNRGWTSGQSIDVYGRGTVNNVYTYYSSDANACYSGEFSDMKGTLVYFCKRQANAALSHFYALVKESDYINN